MVNGKSNTYQRPLLIVAGSLLALLVLIAVAGTRGGKYLQTSLDDIAKGAVALANYRVDFSNLTLAKAIFDLGATSEDDKCKI